MQQKFHHEDFAILFEDVFREHDRSELGLARAITISEDGVFYDRRELAATGVAWLSWKPSHELAGPDKPRSTGPALLFPCSPADLAAYMIDGWGSYFQDVFGDLNVGLDKHFLSVDHGDKTDAYEALRQAYSAYQQVLQLVGPLDPDLRRHAQAATSQLVEANQQANEKEELWEGGISEEERSLRRARAKASVASLAAETDALQAEADIAWMDWRRAMVRGLRDHDSQIRQAGIMAMIEAQSSDEHLNALAAINAAELEVEITGERLARRKQLLEMPEVWGGIDGLERTEAKVTVAQLDHDRSKKAERTLYGDFVDPGSTLTAPTSGGSTPDRAPAVRSLRHSTKPARTDPLSLVILEAQRRCKNPSDTTEVWMALEAMAEKLEMSLKGADEGGIKYTSFGEPAWIRKNQLRDRLRNQRLAKEREKPP